MAPIDKHLGWLLGAGKEEEALVTAQLFMTEVLGLETERITDRTDNYRIGDLRCVLSGATVEVKGQPIDRDRHRKNFVEVFEDASGAKKEMHEAGFRELAELLKMSEDALAIVPVQWCNVTGMPTRAMGRFTHISVSVTSIAGSKATIYVNRLSSMLYFYPSDALVELVRVAVKKGGFKRGMGKSNQDTHAVQVPVADLRWQSENRGWVFVGSERIESSAIQRAKDVLAKA